ncbi:796_t:CDS:2 [Entrophospora sp. SA101]|nr:796_t:CDS:2 [Entrophospora sp. SA101]
MRDIRAVVALVFKTNTVLSYDDSLKLLAWGYPALAEEPSKRSKRNQTQSRPVELFKLHLANVKEDEKPPLPLGLDSRRAITDYLHEMNKVSMKYPQQVRFVISVPAEWGHDARAVMRECMYNAGYLEARQSDNLEFTTEPEAAAIYCIKTLAEHNLAVGSSFMIVDCGGGTVDLTTRTLLPQNKLGEITERSGDLCGSSYVDREFLKYLGKKLGFAAMKKLKENNYGQLQYLVQYFCNRVKFTFSGNPNGFTTKEIDIEKVCPALMKYVTGNARDQMEEAEWLIELEFQVIKDMFDPVVNKIIELIRRQLGQMERRCMAMFLVGGFSESLYLQYQIRRNFMNMVTIIAVPKHPIAAVVRGSLEYGLNMGVVQTRVLKFCYGVEVSAKWEKNDPPERKTPTGRIFRFHKLAFRGTEVSVDQKFSYTAAPVATNQIDMTFNIFITTDNNARYCDEDGMRMLGKMKIDLPDPQKGKNRLVEFSLTFGTMEVKAMAINKRTGQIYESNFVLEF